MGEASQAKSVTVQVPATTANMGPGFDSIGMALDIWNELTVEVAESFSLEITGEGEDELPRDATNLVCVGLQKAFEKAQKPVPALKYTLINRIPFARGLGSSSAAIVSGVIAGLVLAGHELQVWGKEELLQIAADIEHHPDNVAPCMYGGMQLGIFADDHRRWHSNRVNVPPNLQCILFVPDNKSETAEARAILPDEIPRQDAIYNIGRAAMLVNAMYSGNMEDLKYAMQDKLHQPQRGEKLPHLNPVIDAAVEAGAFGCFLSGAGPSVLAVTAGLAGDIFTQRATERKERLIGDAMGQAAKKAGVSGRVFLTNPTEKGAHVIRSEPSFSSQVVRRY
eukprot:Lithocolla_globosa_v1_NODE_4524_length_1417_cov_15.572687.p1 type:complete len:337 gc:universal NODE_4524_length_1417_cov_15.572687:1051-41(-)